MCRSTEGRGCSITSETVHGGFGEINASEFRSALAARFARKYYIRRLAPMPPNKSSTPPNYGLWQHKG